MLLFSSRSYSRASTGSISPELGGSQSEIGELYPARKPYRFSGILNGKDFKMHIDFRMASSFELGYEQPQVYNERAQKLSGKYPTYNV